MISIRSFVTSISKASPDSRYSCLHKGSDLSLIHILSPSGAREAKSRLAGYFEQIFVFSQNNWSIFLLNYSVKLQTEDIRAILAHVLDGSISGIADTKQNGEKQA